MTAGHLTHDRAIPIFPGDDLAVAKDFYVRKLGFTVAWESSEDARTGIMGLELGTIELMIDCPMSGHGRNVCASVRGTAPTRTTMRGRRR